MLLRLDQLHDETGFLAGGRLEIRRFCRFRLEVVSAEAAELTQRGQALPVGDRADPFLEREG